MATRTGTRRYLAQKMTRGEGFRTTIVDDSRTCSFCRQQKGKFHNGTGTKPPKPDFKKEQVNILKVLKTGKGLKAEYKDQAKELKAKIK